MAATPPVFVITGQLAAGKSTVARAVLDHYPFGLHVDVDAVREMVTSGLAGPLQWSEETSRQFALAVGGVGRACRRLPPERVRGGDRRSGRPGAGRPRAP